MSNTGEKFGQGMGEDECENNGGLGQGGGRKGIDDVTKEKRNGESDEFGGEDGEDG